jgi:HD-GYP domain-containing protein (c-di-GMP phosphodiesterase class II)
MEVEKVLDIIRGAASTQFDPQVVEALLTLHSQGKIDFAAA